jgi:hypothetical protein
MGCSDMLFPAVDMHIYCASGAVIKSGAGLFAADRALHSYFIASSVPLLSSFAASLTLLSGTLFLLSVT